jgi:TolB-like protein/DNA-binding winged helix-turn-helix (wHTH) protein
MTIRGVKQVQPDCKRLSFEKYVLDLDRGCLLLHGNEIPLRPKAFALLQCLVANAGRLLSKDDLAGAVWPNMAITDDVLVQTIGDLRRALGDDGSGLIKTVPRRGYRFEAAVLSLGLDSSVVATALQDLPTLIDPTPPGSSTPHAGHTPADPVDVAAPPCEVINSPKHEWQPSPSSPVVSVLPAWRDLSAVRRSLVGALALAALLVVGMIWTRVGNERVLPGEQKAVAVTQKTADVAARPAIAILPFVNQSDDAARDYFADGLTQDIINALGRYSDLTVFSWNAVLPFKGKSVSPAELSGRLGARYHVEGSVRRTDDRVRVATQLVDADSRVIWSARLDEALADLFAVQDRITTQIAGALAIRLTDIEHHRVLGKPTDNLEAYDFVLRARPALQRPDRANLAEARSLLRRALQLDPNYAAAYAALAETYDIDVTMGWAEAPAAHLRRAEEMARKALSLNPAEVRARIILARIHLLYQRYGEAQSEIDRAIGINPNDARGLAGRVMILMWLGQADAAVEALELAKRIDPEPHAIDRFAFTLAYYLTRRYEAAVEQAKLNLNMTPGAPFAGVVLAAALGQLGRRDEAMQAADTARRTDPTLDASTFGNKFLKLEDLKHLREGMRKAGFDVGGAD